ncbi:MAG TPA: DUF481 domain-containing protein [Verrucomicrobiae bacterium]|nr:DUF481 domain-containing protein [Verrucomicrobiae bacterium]
MKIRNHHLVKFTTLALAAAFFASGAATRADEIQPVKKNKWENVAALGLTLTRGNSKTFLATATINSTRKWDHDEALLGLSAGYGETTANVGKNETTSTTDNYIKGFGQWNHDFSGTWASNFYGGLRLGIERDAVADLDYRMTVSPLLGYYLLKRTNTFVALEAGPSFVYEKQGGDEKSYMAARVAERAEYKFHSGAKVWESIEWLPQVDNFDNWIANSEFGVSAPISKTIDIRLVLQDTYDNQPAEGRYKNDLKLIAALGFKF